LTEPDQQTPFERYVTELGQRGARDELLEQVRQHGRSPVSIAAFYNTWLEQLHINVSLASAIIELQNVDELAKREATAALLNELNASIKRQGEQVIALMKGAVRG
jgi:hypothetical protein